MTAVDRRQWLRRRIAFLEGQLAGGDLTDSQRAQAEIELATLREEARGSGLLSRLFRVWKRPTDR